MPDGSLGLPRLSWRCWVGLFKSGCSGVADVASALFTSFASSLVDRIFDIWTSLTDITRENRLRIDGYLHFS